jgi:hypothetical protein
LAGPFPRELGLIVAWLIFPLVPVILEDFHYQFSNPRGADPRDWDWVMWVLLTGPLIGYGFPAGATADLPEELGPSRRGWRRLVARRSVSVAVGPWWSSVILAAGICAESYLMSQFISRSIAGMQEPNSWKGTWVGSVSEWIAGALAWVFLLFLAMTWSYGWLWPAWTALRQAS